MFGNRLNEVDKFMKLEFLLASRLYVRLSRMLKIIISLTTKKVQNFIGYMFGCLLDLILVLISYGSAELYGYDATGYIQGMCFKTSGRPAANNTVPGICYWRENVATTKFTGIIELQHRRSDPLQQSRCNRLCRLAAARSVAGSRHIHG
jgi:hypothetical protein